MCRFEKYFILVYVSVGFERKKVFGFDDFSRFFLQPSPRSIQINRILESL